MRSTHDLAVFHRVKPTRRILVSGTETIFIPRYDNERGSKCLYKVSHCYDTLQYSSTISIPVALETVQAIFRNGSYRRFRHQVHCRRVRSFLAILFHCSLRRNSSRYALDRLAAIWAFPFSYIREAGFCYSDKSMTRERRRWQLRQDREMISLYHPLPCNLCVGVCEAK